MSNYVWHKVVCQKEILEKYFIDTDPFGDGTLVEPPYVSFNQLFGVRSLNEYSDKYGVYISYGYSFSWNLQSDGLCEIKFCTRWEYPIRAIIRTLELSHNTVWFAVEENHVYVSKFYWSDGIKEDVILLGEEFDRWLDVNMAFDDSLEDPDDGVWYYLPTSTGTWQNWESNDGFARYLDVAAVHVELPLFQK
jgi:hypothetical protein